jgi:hypothetical protein
VQFQLRRLKKKSVFHVGQLLVKSKLNFALAFWAQAM